LGLVNYRRDSGASVSSASKKRKADGEVGKTVAERKSAPVELKGFDGQGNKLVHDIQEICRLKTTLKGVNKIATCSVCKRGSAVVCGATNYCTGCTDRAGGKIIAVCGMGSGCKPRQVRSKIRAGKQCAFWSHSCIGRHFAEKTPHL
jgi:hypothetical protein